MSVPAIVQSRLDGEQVAAEVPLGGEDGLFVTPTRTLIYRADGLLSDESVEEYSHEAERIVISEGRRKSAIELDYGIDGTKTFKIPSNRLYEALHPVLAGVLNAADVTGPEETVLQTYQFSELTLVITSERVVKHVGAAVWDEDYEEFHFEDVTALEVEEGSVSSQIIIEDQGRPQRIKTPSDQTREVRERIEQALLDYHDLASYEAFARSRAVDSDDAETDDTSENDPLAGGGVTPIDANPPELDDEGEIVDEAADDARVHESSASESDGASATTETETTTTTDSTAQEAEDPLASETTESASDTAEQATEQTGTDDPAQNDAMGDDSVKGRETTQSDDSKEGFADSGFEPASSELEDNTTEEQLRALTEAVERQNELLVEHHRKLEMLVEELKRGR